jgi:hypothetical protein
MKLSSLKIKRAARKFRAVLCSNGPLKKELQFDAQPNRGRFVNRDRKFERTMLYALMGKRATIEETQKALSIAQCDLTDQANLCVKSSWLCHVCRHAAHLGDQGTLRMQRARSRAGRSISFLTIVVAVSHEGTGGIEESILSANARLAGLFRKLRNNRALGRYEIDLLRPGKEPGTFKVQTLRSLGYKQDHEVPALVWHLHAVVFHRNIPRSVLLMKVQKEFPGFRRVQAKGLFARKKLAHNLADLCGYMLKFDPPEDSIAKQVGEVRSPRPDELLFYYRLIEGLGGLNGVLRYVFDG